MTINFPLKAWVHEGPVVLESPAELAYYKSHVERFPPRDWKIGAPWWTGIVGVGPTKSKELEKILQEYLESAHV